MFNFFNKDNEPVISFVSKVPGITEIEEARPVRASRAIPSWWRNTPRFIDASEGNRIATVKTCPSFVDYFSQGFVIPSWSDAELVYDKQNDIWMSKTARGKLSSEDYDWSVHGHQQFLDHADVSFYGMKPTMVFKAESPWRTITKPGWSVLQIPLFYHFDNPIVALPGIIDTDIEHEMNIQMLYFGDNEVVKIRRGQPLVHYIPFKREKELPFDIREATEQDFHRFNIQSLKVGTKQQGNGAYRIMQKERDTKENK